ncbi:TPA: hypothetical protein HJT61_005281, partial [Escherichia coli]|nr:hypothetical protein [Escherichia coli]
MAHHEVISRSGNAFLLNIRESVLLPGSMSEMHFFLLIGISSIHSDGNDSNLLIVFYVQ